MRSLSMSSGSIELSTVLDFENSMYLVLFKFSDNLFALSHWHILFKSELAISMSSLL